MTRRWPGSPPLLHDLRDSALVGSSWSSRQLVLHSSVRDAAPLRRGQADDRRRHRRDDDRANAVRPADTGVAVASRAGDGRCVAGEAPAGCRPRRTSPLLHRQPSSRTAADQAARARAPRGRLDATRERAGGTAHRVLEKLPNAPPMVRQAACPGARHGRAASTCCCQRSDSSSRPTAGAGTLGWKTSTRTNGATTRRSPTATASCISRGCICATSPTMSSTSSIARIRLGFAAAS